ILRFWIDIINRLPFNKRYRECYECGDRPDMVIVYRAGHSEYYQFTCIEHKEELIKKYTETVELRTFDDISETRYKKSALQALLCAKGYRISDLTGEDKMDFLLSEDEEAQLFNLSMTKSKPDPKTESLLQTAEGRE